MCILGMKLKPPKLKLNLLLLQLNFKMENVGSFPSMYYFFKSFWFKHKIPPMHFSGRN